MHNRSFLGPAFLRVLNNTQSRSRCIGGSNGEQPQWHLEMFSVAQQSQYDLGRSLDLKTEALLAQLGPSNGSTMRMRSHSGRPYKAVARAPRMTQHLVAGWVRQRHCHHRKILSGMPDDGLCTPSTRAWQDVMSFPSLCFPQVLANPFRARLWLASSSIRKKKWEARARNFLLPFSYFNILEPGYCCGKHTRR
jgi:hypothetical protein